MPLKKGHSPEVISHNIKEMVKAGHPRKQAIAASLANSRKYKKMAEGGLVEPMSEFDEKGPDDNESSLYELSKEGESHPDEVANPNEIMEDEGFHAALKREHDKEMSPEHYAMGGLVEDGPAGDEPYGNKPSEDMEDSTEEPMSDEPMKPSDHKASPMLTIAAMEALEERKKKRRFS